MRRTRRTAALITYAIAITVAVSIVSFSQAVRTAKAQVDPATRALQYLQGQQSAADGSLNQGDVFSSSLYAIGAGAGGYDPKALRHGNGLTVMDFFAAHGSAACLPATGTAGRCGAVLQAVAAAGLDARNFPQAGSDLVTMLNGFFNPASGGFGDHEAFTQALAIQGLLAVEAPVPSVAVSFVKNAQDGDGGWDFKAIKNDPSGSDTNSTAMLLMALDAIGDHSHDAAALHWLHTQQNADGGFSYQATTTPPTPSDPDSTALVIQALIGAGQNPAGPTWATGGHTPFSELVATQDATGGYIFPGSTGADAFTTVQVPPALERVAFPVPFSERTFYQPGSTLPVQNTTPTSTPTPSPTPNAGVEGASTPVTPSTGAALSSSVALAYALAGIGCALLVGAATAHRPRRRRR